MGFKSKSGRGSLFAFTIPLESSNVGIRELFETERQTLKETVLGERLNFEMGQQ